MKPQSRPFVVEVKQSRRVDRDQTKSIWKGVNLTGVTRQVVDELAEKPDVQAIDGQAKAI